MKNFSKSAFIKEWLLKFAKFENLKNSRIRSDAWLVLAHRKYMRIPYNVLKYFGKNRIFGHKNLKEYLRVLVRFYLLFCKVFDVVLWDERQNIHLFYDYIMLFPNRNQIIQLYDEFLIDTEDVSEKYQEGYSLEERQQVVNQWKRWELRHTTIKKTIKFYKKNAAYQIIMDSFSNLIKKICQKINLSFYL